MSGMTDNQKKISHSLPSKGRGFFRKEFYSIHSGGPCKLAVDGVCEHGQWVNVYAQTFSSGLFKLSPRLWRIWANRPMLNSRHQFLVKMFPGLDRKEHD